MWVDRMSSCLTLPLKETSTLVISKWRYNYRGDLGMALMGMFQPIVIYLYSSFGKTRSGQCHLATENRLFCGSGYLDNEAAVASVQ